MASKKDLNAFQDRLKRIAKEKKDGHKYLAGEGDVSQTTLDIKKMQAKQRAKEGLSGAELILSAPKWAIAFVLGCAAMLAGRLLGFHVLGQFINQADMMQVMLRHAGEIGAGFAILVAAATFWGPRGPLAKMSMMAGFSLMLLAEEDVAKQAPAAWEAMFSPAYAADALQPTAGVMQNLQSIKAAFQNIPL